MNLTSKNNFIYLIILNLKILTSERHTLRVFGIQVMQMLSKKNSVELSCHRNIFNLMDLTFGLI